VLTAEAITLHTTFGNDESGSNNGLIPTARTLRLVDTASGTSILTAAKDLSKKEIFSISNVNNELLCDDIGTYVKSINVRVISCFVAKTCVPDTKAFHICIDKADRRSFLDKGHWPQNIAYRAWSLKKKSAVQALGPTDNSSDCEMFTDAPCLVSETIQTSAVNIVRSSASDTIVNTTQP